MPIVSTILYILNKKSKKKPALNRLKFQTKFYIYTHNRQRLIFLINHVMNVMNNTTILNIFNSHNSNIAYIKTKH